MKKACAAAAMLVLAGCATHAPKPSQVRSVPPERVLAFQDANNGDGAIIVTRDEGLAGSGCYLAVYIDGKESAKLGTGERVTFHVPSGHHVLGTWTTGKALCSYRQDTDRREVDASLNSGETRKFRILIDGGGLKLEPTSL